MLNVTEGAAVPVGVTQMFSTLLMFVVDKEELFASMYKVSVPAPPSILSADEKVTVPLELRLPLIVSFPAPPVTLSVLVVSDL